MISSAIAAAIPAITFASRGSWVWVSLSVLFGILILFGEALRLKWTGTLTFIGLTVAIVRCVFLEVSPEWLLLSIVAALSSWDLQAFIHRIHRDERVEKAPDLEKQHIKRLVTALGPGFLLGWITLKISIHIRFGWMLFFGIAITIGLSRLIERIGREDP